MIDSYRKNNKSRPLYDITKLYRVFHVLGHISFLRSIQRQLLDIIKDFVQFDALSFRYFFDNFTEQICLPNETVLLTSEKAFI